MTLGRRTASVPRMARTAQWIDTTADLAAFLAGSGAGRGPLVLDSEADSFHHYRERVCLVQLASAGAIALVDPLAGVDLSALAAAASDAARRKILHGADYDVRLLHRDFGLAFVNVFDTMIAARLAGEPAAGLASLLERHLGVTLDKSHQRADWSRRPLTPEMRDYAAEDVAHLESLADLLEERLDRLGRLAWLREECARLVAVRWRNRRDEDPEAFRRVKGSAALPPRALGVIRELWAFRDAVARRRDKPPFRIVRDETLVALAQSPPSGEDDLRAVRGMPRALPGSPDGSRLLEAVRRGLACPEDDLPAPRNSARVRLAPEVAREAARFREARDGVARALALEPTLLASRAVLEEMGRRSAGGEDPWGVPELRRWQTDLLREAVT